MLSYGHCDQNVSSSMTKMCSLAKAKYDNFAESHDELAFRKGDVLTVIDQKIDGLEGWWLCSFRGRQGIVPANRVTLLAGMYNESALRFSTSPESSISDGGGGVDYDIPRHSYQNRQLPPVPDQTKPVLQSTKTNDRGTPPPVRELVYDIPKSLEKTRIQSTNGAKTVPAALGDNTYDTPTRLHVLTPANVVNQRSSGGTLSPLYKSGDSAVDMKSNRSSMMSNNSSPPGSSVCDSSSEMTDFYDTPNKLAASRRVNLESQQTLFQNTNSKPSVLHNSVEGYYDVPKTLQQTMLEYRDSGIYDNARLSTVQTSPVKDSSELYDSPVSLAAARRTSQLALVYDVPSKLRTDSANSTPRGSNNQLHKIDSLEITTELDKLSLELDAAIEIVVKLQQHVHTSTNRLLSFVHSKWRQRSNLESILYDLKIACVGLQSTLQEFFDFGIGALANSAELTDRTVMNRLSQVLVPLKHKLDTVNNSMKCLSGIKWHIAKLEEVPSGVEANSGAADLLKLMAVAREVSEDVNRVASVIHGNSRLLFKSNKPSPSSVQGLLTEARDQALQKSAPVTGKYLVKEESVESYHEYDYCEVNDEEHQQPSKPDTNLNKSAIDLEQDGQYLQYYLQHVHTICDTVKQHITRLKEIVDSGVESNQTMVAQSKLVVSTAHNLVYIGDTLCRCLKQPTVHAAITDDANALCNTLKELIMTTKEAALAQPTGRASAFSKLRANMKSVQRQSESFRNVIQTYSK